MFNLLNLRRITQSTGDILKDIIIGLENWCVAFNNFILLFYKYIKFVFVLIIISIGILTLFRLRGVYRQERLVNSDKQAEVFKKPRLILGLSYLFLGFGILFNYFTYFLIWIFDPIPDKLIYGFIDFSGIDPFYLNGIMDISASQYPHEKTIYYCFSLGSLISVLDILLSLWYLVNNNRLINNPKRAFGVLFTGIGGGILFGFTTYLPFFL